MNCLVVGAGYETWYLKESSYNKPFLQSLLHSLKTFQCLFLGLGESGETSKGVGVHLGAAVVAVQKCPLNWVSFPDT